MGLFGKLFGGFIEKRNPEFYRAWSINSCINMCESLYEDFSRKIPNKDPHEYLVWVYRDIMFKSGAIPKSALNEPNFVWDLLEATLKLACLPPPICARALAYTLISRDQTLFPDFITNDDFKTYHDEYERYLVPLMGADDNTLRDLYCKYNKNVQHQQTVFGKEHFKTEKKQDSSHTARTEAELSQKTKDYAVYFDRGLAHVKNGNYHQAIEDFNKAIELNQKEAEAYYNRGVAHGNLGNYNQAVMDYSKVIEMKSKDAQAYYNRGLNYSKLDNNNQAIRDYDKAIELNPKFAEAYCMRGCVHGALGNFTQTEDDLKIAARLGNQLAQDFLRKQEIAW